MMAAGKVKRAQTAGEELANTLSHGFGAVLALGGAIPLVVRAAMSGSAKAVFSLAAYGISLVVLYTASTVYHAVKRPSLKAVLRVMDHCSIFLCSSWGPISPCPCWWWGAGRGGCCF